MHRELIAEPFVRKSLLCHLAFSLALATTALAAPFEPAGILLTWQRDPTTTMTIDWHSVDGDNGEIGLVESVGQNQVPITIPVVRKSRAAVLEYRPAGEERWTRATGGSEPYPFTEDRMKGLHRDGYSQPYPPAGRTIHRVELTGLRPDGRYEFRFDGEGRIHRFRTLPRTLTREVRIAMGGDIGYGVWTERMNRVAASFDPDFAVWGGDIAYADGEQQKLGRWYGFFDSLTRTLVAKDGRRIPVLVGIGNHEAIGGYYATSKVKEALGSAYGQDDATRKKLSPYFYSFFAFPGQPGYNVLDAGDYLSVILLDSGHNNPIEGAQAAWLEATLGVRRRVPHVFPVYHVPAFPSFRPLTDARVKGVREHWVPLFEKYGLPVVFENHDHNYKRTHPIRNGKIDAQNGVVYLGDGAWGVLVTGLAKDSGQRWYLEKTGIVNHFILARLNGPIASFEAINLKGEVIDRHTARRK